MLKHISGKLRREVDSWLWRDRGYKLLGHRSPGPPPSKPDDVDQDAWVDLWTRRVNSLNELLHYWESILEQINPRVLTPQQARVVGWASERILAFGLDIKFNQQEITLESKNIEVDYKSGIKVEEKHILSSTLQLIHTTCSIFSCILDPGVYRKGLKGQGWEQGRKSELKFDSVEQLLRLSNLPDRGQYAATSIKLPPLRLFEVPDLSFQVYHSALPEGLKTPSQSTLTTTASVKGVVCSVSAGQVHCPSVWVDLRELTSKYGIWTGQGPQKTRFTNGAKKLAKEMGLTWNRVELKEGFTRTREVVDKDTKKLVTKKYRNSEIYYTVQGTEEQLDRLGFTLKQQFPWPEAGRAVSRSSSLEALLNRSQIDVERPAGVDGTLGLPDHLKTLYELIGLEI
jgi:hypothetical protein